MALRSRWLAVLALACAMASGHNAPAWAAADRLQSVPRVMLWAWERPEDLRGLDPRAGVAYLAATYRLRSAGIETALRHQPLKVDAATPLVAVVRIETAAHDRPVLSADQAEWLAERIATLRSTPGVRAVQIDFDATLSERAFYADFLAALRRRLGAFPLSITALASWCGFDHWIDGLPIDEAVPMLFRMGPSNDAFLEAGASGMMRAPLCRGAVGISTDEPTPPLAGYRRTYIFHSASWTKADVANVIREANR